jgi:hypothetical protein
MPRPLAGVCSGASCWIAQTLGCGCRRWLHPNSRMQTALWKEELPWNLASSPLFLGHHNEMLEPKVETRSSSQCLGMCPECVNKGTKNILIYPARVGQYSRPGNLLRNL